MPANRVRVGGTFAPPLDDSKLDQYEQLAGSAPPEVAEPMQVLIRMVRKFRETPRSPLDGTPHPSGTGMVVPLEQAEIDRIWDDVPWRDELEMYSRRFDAIDPVAARDLRNAAFHLLWYGRELERDREPITNDRL